MENTNQNGTSPKAVMVGMKNKWDGLPPVGKYALVAVVVAVIMIIAFMVYSAMTGQDPQEVVESMIGRNKLSAGVASVGPSLRQLGNA